MTLQGMRFFSYGALLQLCLCRRIALAHTDEEPFNTFCLQQDLSL